MISETLKQDLQALTLQGNTATLPTTQLNSYAELKKALTKANGKYKRNTFEFPCLAKPVIDLLLTGEVIDFKKEFQFFPTQGEVLEQMVNEIVGYPERMLEPQAGHGHIIDAVREFRPDVNITAVELADLNFGVLQDKYNNSGVTLHHEDFLKFNTDKKFDLIIANPPFSKNQDVDHFYKMWELLEKGGQLITIMSSSWTFGNQKKQQQFRDFIEEIEAVVRTNENDAFKASGTMVNSVMVTAVK